MRLGETLAEMVHQQNPPALHLLLTECHLQMAGPHELKTVQVVSELWLKNGCLPHSQRWRNVLEHARVSIVVGPVKNTVERLGVIFPGAPAR